MTKKLTLISCVLFCVCSCGPKGEENPKSKMPHTSEIPDSSTGEIDTVKAKRTYTNLILGKWEADEKVLGYPFELEFLDDGTYISIMSGQDEQGTYQLQENKLKIDNKHLKIGHTYNIKVLNDTAFIFTWNIDLGETEIQMKRVGF